MKKPTLVLLMCLLCDTAANAVNIKISDVDEAISRGCDENAIWTFQYQQQSDNPAVIAKAKKAENRCEAMTDEERTKDVLRAKQLIEEKRIAEEKKRIAEEQIIEEKKIAKEQARVKAATAALAAWRKSLKVGDDTFCGPVIEIRGPMFKLALNAQVPGFSSEPWLKFDQIFPPAAGCRNVQGHLSPLVSTL